MNTPVPCPSQGWSCFDDWLYSTFDFPGTQQDLPVGVGESDGASANNAGVDPIDTLLLGTLYPTGGGLKYCDPLGDSGGCPSNETRPQDETNFLSSARAIHTTPSTQLWEARIE